MAGTGIKYFDEKNAEVDDSELQVVGAPLVLTGRYDRIAFEVQNNGAATGDDLADFAVQVKTHVNSGWTTLLSDTDWAGLNDDYVAMCVTDPKTLAKGGRSFVRIYLGPLYSLRFMAKADTGKTTEVRILGIAQSEGKRTR